MKLWFVSLFALVLSPGAPAQTASNNSSDARIKIFVHVNTQQPKDNDGNYHVKFALTAKNEGSSAYDLTGSMNPLWNLKVYRQDSTKNESAWSWSNKGPQIFSLAPGEEVQATTKWETAVPTKTATYIVAATFRPTGDVTATTFVLSPREMKVNILFTGRLMGYYRLPDRQSKGDRGCGGGKPSLDASVFFDRFGRFNKFGDSPVNEIRLGMGDNFAPNYYSRAFDTSKGADHLDPAKYFYSWDTIQQQWRPITETPDNLKDIQNGHGKIAMDNVACFFLQAHYDAIVPAKHDIYYGPDRLRGLARLLATPKEKNLQPVQMLAANMVVKTTWAKGHEPVPDSAKHQLSFVTEYTPTKKGPFSGCRPEVTTLSDRGFAFPWMQFVRITVKGCTVPFDKSALHVFLCKTSGPDDRPGDPDNFIKGSPDKFCHEGRDLGDTVNDPVQPEKKGTTKESSESHELVYSLVPVGFSKKENPSFLTPGHNYAICVVGPEADQKKVQQPYCVRFSVYTPFFQYPDWPEKRWPKEEYDQQLAVHYTNPSLYVLKNDTEGRTPVVIFGVVDPQLLEDVGADNSSWQTIKGDSKSGHWEKDYDTRMAVVDPVETLTELEDYFEKDYESTHGRKFHGLRVLMAEMSPGRARQLAERLPKGLRFDVILSSADDALATPNQEVHIQPAVYLPCAPCDEKETAAVNGAMVTPASFLAVPPPHDQAKGRHLQARELSVTTDGVSYWNYSLSGDPIPVPVPDTKSLAGVNAGAKFWTAVCHSLGAEEDEEEKCDQKAGGWDDAAKTTAIHHLALWSMRKKYGADIALLQERDFYIHGVEDYLSEHCKPSAGDAVQCDEPLNIQEILDRVIWKGDLIKTRSIKGSVLKSILKESDQFADREKKTYLHVSDVGRPLVKLGIRKDPNVSDNFLVNSRPLDPNAIYAVATSDYIALGDTGYPELAKIPAGDSDQPAWAVGKVYRIAGLACEDIPPSKAMVKNCEVPIQAKDYFDRAANREPDNPNAGNTNLHKFYAWTFLRTHLGQQARKAPDATIPLEKRVNWEWSIEQLGVGFSGISHTDSEQTLSQRFGGVLNSQVNANRAHSWDWDVNSKLTFYQPTTDWFLEERLQYTSNFTAQAGGPRIETQSNNLVAFDGGAYFHLYHWRSKELPQLSLVLSGHFETQVGDPNTVLALNAISPSANSTTLTFGQGRTAGLLGRSGLRWQNRKSYIEAGLEGGSVLNAIKQFDILVAPGGATVPCALEASVSLTNCLNAFNQDNPTMPVTGGSKVRVQRSPQDRYGAYWRIGMTVPINPVISYNFKDTSEYFFLSSGDNSADTRFRHELVSSVRFMVLPNLAFEPTYTIFLYENKLDYNFLLQQRYSVKITYSFNVSNLHESKRQFKYAKGSSE